MARRGAAALHASDPADGGADRLGLSPGTNTRRVQRAVGALFRGAVGKAVVGRAWRKAKADRDGRCRRGLAGEDVVRLVLGGTAVKVRLDRKATSLSLPVVLGIRRDGQKVLLAARSMGGESEPAWRGDACGASGGPKSRPPVGMPLTWLRRGRASLVGRRTGRG